MRSSAMPSRGSVASMSSLIAGRAADEDVVDRGGRHQRAQQHRAPCRRSSRPLQDRHVLLLARQHVEHARAAAMKRSFSSSSASRNRMPDVDAVAVEQEEAAVRLARQHALDDREDRRDAGARGEADIDPRLARARGVTPKRPVGVITSSSSPAFSSSAAQLENAPPSTFFTAMRSSPSSGPEQIE